MYKHVIIQINFISSYSASWVKKNGVKYQKGACVIVGMNADELLLFGLIVNVYIIQYQILFQVKILETIEFDDHFHAFVVNKKVDPDVFVWDSQLYDHHVYGLYTQPVLSTGLTTTHKNLLFLNTMFF